MWITYACQTSNSGAKRVKTFHSNFQKKLRIKEISSHTQKDRKRYQKTWLASFLREEFSKQDLIVLRSYCLSLESKQLEPQNNFDQNLNQKFLQKDSILLIIFFSIIFLYTNKELSLGLITNYINRSELPYIMNIRSQRLQMFFHPFATCSEPHVQSPFCQVFWNILLPSYF